MKALANVGHLNSSLIFGGKAKNEPTLDVISFTQVDTCLAPKYQNWVEVTVSDEKTRLRSYTIKNLPNFRWSNNGAEKSKWYLE